MNAYFKTTDGEKTELSPWDSSLKNLGITVDENTEEYKKNLENLINFGFSEQQARSVLLLGMPTPPGGSIKAMKALGIKIR